MRFNFAELGEQLLVLLKVATNVGVVNGPHQLFLVLQMLSGVLIHHHFTVLQTLTVGRFQKAVDSGEPDLVLGVNGSIADLVTVFPFNSRKGSMILRLAAGS